MNDLNRLSPFVGCCDTEVILPTTLKPAFLYTLI
jgi:hypothetical protein